jgi:hypothetical protein
VRVAQNFPPIFTIVPMKFQLLHRAVKGMPVVSLNTVTRAIHIWLLARQLHNARILPTAAASHPARLRHSLLAATLLFSSPTAPCVTTVARTRLLTCRVRLANLKTVDADPSMSSPATTTTSRPVSSGHEPPWIRPLRPSREQLLHS